MSHYHAWQLHDGLPVDFAIRPTMFLANQEVYAKAGVPFIEMCLIPKYTIVKSRQGVFGVHPCGQNCPCEETPV